MNIQYLIFDHRGQKENPSIEVAMEIAASENVPPTELQPLFDSIDPDALDKLIRSMLDGAINFHHSGYAITVYADGEFDVEPMEVDKADEERQ